MVNILLGGREKPSLFMENAEKLREKARFFEIRIVILPEMEYIP